MSPLVSYLTGLGLASGAGARASIAVLVVGLFHHTPYFELSERWSWIASPPVLAVLAALVALEWWVDAHPELGFWSDLAAYLPKWIAGFLVFAAATGSLDESLARLGASGLLGGGTAVGVHWLRNLARRPFREHLEEMHRGFGRLASFGEAGLAATVSASAILVPVLALAMIVVALAAGLVLAGRAERRRVACGACGGAIRPGALVCRHCGAEQAEAAASG